MVRAMSPLNTYLIATGKTQKQFAEAMGVREATVSAWKNGGTPRPAQMKRIAEVTKGAIPITAWFEQESRSA